MWNVGIMTCGMWVDNTLISFNENKTEGRDKKINFGESPH
jgi:hypothetical protein